MGHGAMEHGAIETGLSPEPVLPVLEQAEFIGTGRNRQNS